MKQGVTRARPNTRRSRGAPGADETEREREITMVFLDVLVNYGCRRWLHKEDYTFE